MVRVGGWDRSEAPGRLYFPIGLFEVAMSIRNIVIGLHKRGGPKRCLTNTGVNIRPIPLI